MTLKSAPVIFSVGALFLLSAFAGGAPRANPLQAQATSTLTLIILVDVTASQHMCPAGVAGIPSTAGTNMSSGFKGMRMPGKIPPAIDQFPLEGLEAGDRVRVGSIGRKLTLGDKFNSDPREISRAWGAVFSLPPIEWLGPSPIHDAIFEAVTVLSAESGRRAVVVVTDGQASGNRHSYREAADLAARAGVSISAVAEGIMTPTVPMRPLSDFGVDLTRDLKAMAAATGGVVVEDVGVWDQQGPCYRRSPRQFLSQLLDKLRPR